MLAVGAAVTTGGPEIPLWLWVLLPSLSVMFAGGMFLIAWAPGWRRRLEIRREHERRVSATCDAVLGKDANPAVGQLKVKGLVEVVPDIAASIGRTNGKTVMDHIEAIEGHLGIRGQH